ncbi:MAG: hypothetical protein QXO02_04305, partial [Thermofilaceae archaeon]
EVLRFAGWRRKGWRERGLPEEYCCLEVKGEKLYIGACGRMFFALLRGCEEEFRVSVKLSYLAEALEAFMLAKLVPGSIAFTREERRAVLIQLRGVAEGVRSRSPRVRGSGALYPIPLPFPLHAAAGERVGRGPCAGSEGVARSAQLGERERLGENMNKCESSVTRF